MPIDKPGSRALELEYDDRFAEHIEAFDPDFFNTLVRYNPLEDEVIRHTTITRLAAVSEWAEGTNRRWIIELLVRPTPEQRSTHHNRHGLESDALFALTAQAISQLHSGQGFIRRSGCWKGSRGPTEQTRDPPPWQPRENIRLSASFRVGRSDR